jgi:orotate phosphoribosyltransferase
MTDKTLELLKESGALLEGHFLLSSGRHSNGYCQCALLLRDPERARDALASVAERAREWRPDLVLGPALGGIVVSYELARQLGLKGIFAERENEALTLRRGFSVTQGSRVLIAEDVVTTGKSTLETAALVESAGATVVGAACVADRGESSLPFPIIAGTKLRIESWDAGNCPLCARGIPYVKPGTRQSVK